MPVIQSEPELRGELSSTRCPELLCLSESNAVLTAIEDGVVASDEDVSENPEWARWRGYIQSREAAYASANSENRRRLHKQNKKLKVFHRILRVFTRKCVVRVVL